MNAKNDAEEALRASEDRFRALTEISSDWFWETDAEHRFTFLSIEQSLDSSIERTDILGRTRWELFPDSRTPQDWDDHKQTLTAHRPFQGMVTRKGWDGKTWGANQRITRDEALRVNTINGAYNSSEEAIKGSITPGKLADFVVLSDDLFTVDVEKIKDLEIVRTVVGGSTMYQA